MARLPQPGGDDGNWGDVLNDYLLQAHTNDGSLKPQAVSAAAIQDAAITEDKLAPALAAKLNNTASGGVTSVNTRTGAVVLNKDDVGLGQVDNTADINKPVSQATQAALDGKADKAHRHEIRDVNGLQETLDTKLAAGHKHVIDDVTDLRAVLDGKQPAGNYAPAQHSHALNDLSDVSTGGATSGQALLYNGNGWAPGTVSAGGTTPDATTSGKGVIQLAGDLGGTAAAPTVPGLAQKANLNHRHAIADIDDLQSTLDGKVSANALSGYIPTSQKAAADGVATLDSGKKVPIDQVSTVAALTTYGGAETVATVSANGATTLNLTSGNVFNITLNGNASLSITGALGGRACSCTLYLTQGSGGDKTVTWPSGTRWSGGAPTLSKAAGATDIVVLETINGGTTWFASVVGTNFQ